ncbi:hypothetical protein N4239_05860 [Brachyspira hyodysenteriae]|uniref:hypothetical protein n=1 Tax=Brachyspira hyodysenteriae TaxID=159 RepID=UPI002B25A7B3|nr:hypothetical protein [Brachyspira hyodysenteriae]WPC25331.1 hypothetical protein N4239_05860 [Brachyspira hyodysenteriae]
MNNSFFKILFILIALNLLSISYGNEYTYATPVDSKWYGTYIVSADDQEIKSDMKILVDEQGITLSIIVNGKQIDSTTMTNDVIIKVSDNIYKNKTVIKNGQAVYIEFIFTDTSVTMSHYTGVELRSSFIVEKQ